MSGRRVPPVGPSAAQTGTDGIVHGAPATTNLAFGGDDWRTLYITSRNHLGAVKVKIPGIAVPVAAK